MLRTRSEPEGLLRITAPPDLGHSLLPPLVRKYLRAYPRTRIELLLTNRIVDLVGEGVDLAIRPGPLKDSSLMARKFKDADLFLWASPSYAEKNGLPRHPQELSEYSYISHKSLSGTLKFVNGRQALSAEMTSRLVVDDFEAAKIFILAGDGIGALSPLVCQSEVAKGRITRVLPGWSLQAGLRRASARRGKIISRPPARIPVALSGARRSVSLRLR